MVNEEPIQETVKTSFWKRLPLSQKVSVLMFFLLLLIFPVTLLASFIQVNFYQKASEPITPPVFISPTPSPTPNLLPPCDQKYFMIWYDEQGKIIRQDPYVLKDDKCIGFRCWSHSNSSDTIINEISPVCYNMDQCVTACTGKCVNILQWQMACGYIITPTLAPTITPFPTARPTVKPTVKPTLVPTAKPTPVTSCVGCWNNITTCSRYCSQPCKKVTDKTMIQKVCGKPAGQVSFTVYSCCAPLERSPLPTRAPVPNY